MLALMKRHSREEVLQAIRNGTPIFGVLKNLERYYSDFFEKHSDQVLKPVMDSMLKESKINIEQAVPSNITIDEMPESVQQLADQAYQQNKEFVRSLPTTYFEKMRGPVTDYVAGRNGATLKDIVSAVKTAGDFTTERAHREAMDLVRMTYQGVAVERAKSTGATRGIWIHAYGKGGNPRHRHIEVNGEEFDLVTGEILTGMHKGSGAGYGNDDPQKVLPGQPRYCHCTFKLKIDFGVQ